LSYYVFYTAVFTSPAFFLQTFSSEIKIVLKFLPKKKGGQKRPPHGKLLACGFAVMQQLGFYAIARKSIFLSYCKKQQHGHFFLSYRKDQATSIVICEQSIT
jgi:hypothetical protein